MAVSKAKKSEILADLQKTVRILHQLCSFTSMVLPWHKRMKCEKHFMHKMLDTPLQRKRSQKRRSPKQGSKEQCRSSLEKWRLRMALTPSHQLVKSVVCKEVDNRVEIVGGVFEGKIMDKAAMMTIANIPPLQTLRGMFVNIINSPIQRFAIALSAVAAKKS
jgi:hypothetical protein